MTFEVVSPDEASGFNFNALKLVAVVLFRRSVPPNCRGFLTKPTREKSFPTT